MNDLCSSKHQRAPSTELPSLPAKCLGLHHQSPVLLSFFYFGLQFCYLEVKDEREREAMIILSTFDTEGREDMKRAIQEDMKKLNIGRRLDTKPMAIS